MHGRINKVEGRQIMLSSLNWEKFTNGTHAITYIHTHTLFQSSKKCAKGMHIGGSLLEQPQSPITSCTCWVVSPAGYWDTPRELLYAQRQQCCLLGLCSSTAQTGSDATCLDWKKKKEKDNRSDQSFCNVEGVSQNILCKKQGRAEKREWRSGESLG